MLKHEQLTQLIIEAFYDVYRTLGYGFLEKVYENSLAIALRERGLKADPQVPIKVFFHGQEVGHYFVDLLVNDLIIVEVKSAQRLADEHAAQLLNYLKATEREVGLLFTLVRSRSSNAKCMKLPAPTKAKHKSERGAAPHGGRGLSRIRQQKGRTSSILIRARPRASGQRTSACRFSEIAKTKSQRERGAAPHGRRGLSRTRRQKVKMTSALSVLVRGLPAGVLPRAGFCF